MATSVSLKKTITLDAELWQRMRELGWAIMPENVFEQKRTTSEVVLPSGPEIASALPHLLAVDVTPYKTRQLLLRIQQDESGTWTVGYRRTRLSKSARSFYFS